MNQEILQAIIDNKIVQYKLSRTNTEWYNFNDEYYERTDVCASLFDDCDLIYEWRIKPVYKDVTCKSALMDNGFAIYVLTVNTAEEAIELETNSTFFVKWLTNWITYRVER